MKYLLDTNICIYIIKKLPASVRDRFEAHSVGDIGISAITYCELEFGVALSAQPATNGVALQKFVAPLEILEFRPEIGPVYGQLRSDLVRAGKTIGPLDLLIAAHAKHLGLTLVTNNVREFSRVPGLRIENWVQKKTGR